MKITDNFLKQRYEKDELYFHVYDSYRPNYKKQSITSKFYSKYDALDFSTAEDEIIELIRKAKDKGPSERYSWPATENQWYGWFNKPLVERNPLGYFPLKSTPMIQHMLRLQNDTTMRIPKFTGVPFKLL